MAKEAKFSLYQGIMVLNYLHQTFSQENLKISPRQAPLPRDGSALSPPSLEHKMTSADVFKMTWHFTSKKTFRHPLHNLQPYTMTTLRNISLHQKNNGKPPPLSLIPYTPYTNLRPSFYEEQTIITLRNYAVSVSNPCDISMIANQCYTFWCIY